MTIRIVRFLLILCSIILPAGSLVAQNAQKNPTPAPERIFWWIVVLTVGLMLGGIAGIVIALSRSKKWSLAQVLSEDGSQSGKPSSSRLIALLGFIPIMAVVTAIGFSTVWRLLSGQDVPSLAGLAGCLAAASSLFAPYVANQIGAGISTPTGSLLNPTGGPIPPPKLGGTG